MQAARSLETLTGHSDHAGVFVNDLCLDSRRVRKGDVFFGLARESDELDAHVQSAIAAGAGAIVTEEVLSLGRSYPEVPLITMENVRDMTLLGGLADRFYDQPSAQLKVVGVTGTNGKTSCSHWVAEAWSRIDERAGLLGTLGCGLFREGQRDPDFGEETGLTTADVLSNQRMLRNLCNQEARAVAMEVSSHALDQLRVAGIRIDTAVFTNLTQDHLDYHGDMQAYAAAKAKLFQREELKFAVINIDDAFGVRLCEQLARQRSTCQVLTYSIASDSSDIGVKRSEAAGRGFVAEVRTPWGEGALQSKYPGGFNLLNVLAVISTLCCHGMDLQRVLEVAGQLQAVPGRTQIVSEDTDDVQVIVDYAHSPDALEKILQAVRERCQRELWCVFGCGGNRDRGKRPLMGAAVAANADRYVVTSDNPRSEHPDAILQDVLSGCGTEALVEIDRRAAINMAIYSAQAGDSIVIAGKGHECYQEIDGVRHLFSDVSVAKEALAQRRIAKGVSLRDA